MNYRIVMRNELYHHGIKGQKWGVRRFQNKDGTRTSTGKKHRDETDKSHNKEKAKKIAKYIAIGTAAVAVTAGSMYLYKSGKLDKMISKGKDLLNNHREQKVNDILGISDGKKAKPLTDLGEIKESISNLNPTKSRTNCGSCASAVLNNISGKERRIALDEVPEHMCSTLSNGTRGKGYDPDKLIDCYKTGSWKSVTGLNRREIAKNIEKEIASYGDGAKGILYTDKLSKREYGHYFSWMNKGGKILILEGQPSSEGIIKDDLFNDIVRIFDPIGNVKVARLDIDGIVEVKPGREKDLFK